jgi:RNA polymerase sigma-70 factor (ECF subfamily)
MKGEWETSVIRRVKAGDREAFAAIVENYSGAIYNLMCRFTGDREVARELAQEAFIRVFEQLAHFDGKRRFFPWMYTVALNVARNDRKKARRRPQMLPADVDRVPCRHQSEGGIGARFARQQLQGCIDRLEPHEKEAVVLRYYQDLPFEDIAEILKISCSAAKMRVYRALRRMKVWMEE